MRFAIVFLAVGCAASAATPARQTLSLDGPWQIVFDRHNEGRLSQWHVQNTFERLGEKKTIIVPNCWETVEQDYEGAAWYGRRVHVPVEWKGRAIRLHFGAVNYRAEVWVNDRPGGFHEGGYTPFELRVSDLLKPGEENFLAVRVLGPVLTKGTYLDGIGPNETPHWRGAIAGGLWQSVWLTATDPVYVSDVFVAPDIHRSRATVRATAVNSEAKSRPVTIEFAVAGQTGSVSREIVLRPGNNLVEAEVVIDNVKLWSPEQPHLYTLHTSIHSAAGLLDSVEQRFGMREFSLRGHTYFLNGKKIFIKAGFWEGFYPDTLAFPGNEEVVRREIRLAKEAGFNVLRPWRKPPVPMVLDLADEMGIMIIGAPPIECMGYWPQLAPETEQRIAAEIREMVLRDRNHPSIVYWELFNEILRPGLARFKQGMSLLARELDPTRIVIDESGGWAGGANAYPPYAYDPEPINEIHSYLPAPVEPRTYEFYLHLGQPGFNAKMLGRSQMAAPEGLFFVSEVGYGGLPDLPENLERYQQQGNPLTPDYRFTQSLLQGIERAMREMKWHELFPDVGALCRASQRVQAEGNRLQLEALRLNPRLGGYCLHAYTDGDWVLGAGVLDLFRTPKLTYETVKRVQAPLYLAVQVDPQNVREGQAAQLTIRAVNEREDMRGRLEWEILGPDGQAVQQDRRETPVAGGISTVLQAPLPSLSRSGVHRVRVRWDAATGPRCENEHEFFYMTKKDLLRPPPFAVLDPQRELVPFFEARGIKPTDFTGSENLPVIVIAEAPRGAATLDRFTALMDYVKRGGVAIFLRPPAVRTPPPGASGTKAPNNPLLRDKVFPLQLRRRSARGNWVSVNHGIRAHPIFDGLPVNDFMGQTYLNVCAMETLVGIQAAPIVGSLSFEWGTRYEERNYLGPGAVWWGADLVDVPHGKGRLLLSTLRLIENLEKDPIAEKLLYNMVRWSAALNAVASQVSSSAL